jgi:hypothetical protein
VSASGRHRGRVLQELEAQLVFGIDEIDERALDQGEVAEAQLLLPGAVADLNQTELR